MEDGGDSLILASLDDAWGARCGDGEGGDGGHSDDDLAKLHFESCLLRVELD